MYVIYQSWYHVCSLPQWLPYMQFTTVVTMYAVYQSWYHVCNLPVFTMYMYAIYQSWYHVNNLSQ